MDQSFGGPRPFIELSISHVLVTLKLFNEAHFNVHVNLYSYSESDTQFQIHCG